MVANLSCVDGSQLQDDMPTGLGSRIRSPTSAVCSDSIAEAAGLVLKSRLSNAPGAEFVGVAGRPHGDLSMWKWMNVFFSGTSPDDVPDEILLMVLGAASSSLPSGVSKKSTCLFIVRALQRDS